MKKKMKKRAVKILTVSICMLVLLVTMAVPCFASESIPGIDLPSGYTKDNSLYVFTVDGDGCASPLTAGQEIFGGTSFRYQFGMKITEVPTGCDCGCGVAPWDPLILNHYVSVDLDLSIGFSGSRAYTTKGVSYFECYTTTEPYTWGDYPGLELYGDYYRICIFNNGYETGSSVRYKTVAIGTDGNKHCYSYLGSIDFADNDCLTITAWSGMDSYINGGACKKMCEEGLFTIDASNYESEYDRGYNDGYDWGYDWGYDDGVAIGQEVGYDEGVNDGLEIGFDDGYTAGFDTGYDEGLEFGYDSGYTAGSSEGYDEGHSTGYTEGYGVGSKDATEQGQLLKKTIFAIFEAPVTLINGMLDFDLFGVNLLSLAKTLLTFAVVGVILAVLIKNRT